MTAFLALLRRDLLVARREAGPLLVAFGLQWKSCIEPNRIHDAWRELPHWRSESTQKFHPDDRLLEYLRFDASSFGNLL